LDALVLWQALLLESVRRFHRNAVRIAERCHAQL